MDETDVDELIATHSEESLSNEDLIEFQQSNAPLKDAKSDEDVMVSPPPAKILGLKCLASIFQKAEEFINMIEQEDPNAEKVRSCALVLRSWHATGCSMKRRRRLLYN
jgi:hypothetical protein